MTGSFFWNATIRGERLLLLTLGASLTVHALFLSWSTFLRLRHPPAIEKKMEIVYRAPEAAQTQARKAAPKPNDLRVPSKAVSSRLLETKKALPAELTAMSSKQKPDLFVSGRKTEFLDGMNREKQQMVAIPMLKSDKIDNPLYNNYNMVLRNKISARANSYVEDQEESFQTGEVCLMFIVLSNGRLKEVKIKQDKSSANDYLRAVSLRSIREASPFPPFPANLLYPELPYTVVISFTKPDDN